MPVFSRAGTPFDAAKKDMLGLLAPGESRPRRAPPPSARRLVIPLLATRNPLRGAIRRGPFPSPRTRPPRRTLRANVRLRDEVSHHAFPSYHPAAVDPEALVPRGPRSAQPPVA